MTYSAVETEWMLSVSDSGRSKPKRPSNATAECAGTIRLHYHANGYSEIGLQRCPILAEQINRAEPRYSSKDHHM